MTLKQRQKIILSLIAGLLVWIYFLLQPAPPGIPNDPRVHRQPVASAERLAEPDAENDGPEAEVKASDYFLVTRVVDGDTIQIETGQKVRYIGINTPESVDPRRAVQCFGDEASGYNKKLVAGQKVKLVKDVKDMDKYGRLLRYVYLPNGDFVNLKLAREGYATVMTIPPNVKYAALFIEAVRKAREAKLGLWSECR